MTTSPAPPTPPAIELLEVDIPSLREPGRLVLAGVTWTVTEGDFWVVGGLQGAGKSELLYTAAALHRPTRGECRLFGRKIDLAYTDENLAERLRIGFVFGAGGRLFNHLSVWENIALPLEYHHPADDQRTAARVEALIDATGLQPWARRAPSGVNPSWRQRVALARALAMRPPVLLLDNPLAGLDHRQIRWWVEFLEQLASGHPVMEGRPVTLVVAGNDLRPWLREGRKLALLEGTRLLAVEGPPSPERLQASPALRELLAVQS